MVWRRRPEVRIVFPDKSQSKIALGTCERYLNRDFCYFTG